MAALKPQGLRPQLGGVFFFPRCQAADADAAHDGAGPRLQDHHATPDRGQHDKFAVAGRWLCFRCDANRGLEQAADSQPVEDDVGAGHYHQPGPDGLDVGERLAQ